MKDRFMQIYKDNITRDGSDRLLAWLDKSDFFTAPASTKYHSAFEGGLMTHSLAVYDRLIGHVALNSFTTAPESIAIVSLLHDICKTNFYSVEQRNVKNEQGQWIQQPYYGIKDQLPYGHGEKSVYIVSGFMKLTREESMCIRWHMGEEQPYPGLAAKVYRAYPLSLLLHVSDMEATFMDEEGEK